MKYLIFFLAKHTSSINQSFISVKTEQVYVLISLHKIISVQLTQCAHKRCDILHMRFFIFTFFFHQLSSWSLLLGIFWFLVTKLGEFYKSSKWWKNHQKLQPCIKVLNLSSHFRHLGGRGAGGYWRWRGIYLWDVEGKETGHWQSVDNVRENCCKGRSSHNWHLQRLLLQNFWSKASYHSFLCKQKDFICHIIKSQPTQHPSLKQQKMQNNFHFSLDWDWKSESVTNQPTYMGRC